MMNNYHTTRRSTLAALLLAASGLAGTANAQCGYELTAAVIQPNCGMEDGMIQLLIPEGTEVYSIAWSTGAAYSSLTDLGAGYYSVTVTDWDQCETTAVFHLGCDDDDPGGGGVDDCTLRTQTQGGWGSRPRGQNPGAYLQAGFNAAFPGGLMIGCPGRQLRLTSSSAVSNYLPGGGSPARLPAGVMTDPVNYKNVLAAQLVTATINVRMDAHDPGFAPSSNALGNAVIVSGPFAGRSVQELLDLANAFIGNCGGGPFNASQFNDALSAVNENFVDGNTDNGFLSCVGHAGKAVVSAPVQGWQVYPNPASSHMNVRLDLSRETRVQAALLDLTGRTLHPVVVMTAAAGITEFPLDVNALPEGIYFLRLTSAGREEVIRVVVAR
jgi:hypothetical protein